jgi:hypothetical protein
MNFTCFWNKTSLKIALGALVYNPVLYLNTNAKLETDKLEK